MGNFGSRYSGFRKRRRRTSADGSKFYATSGTFQVPSARSSFLISGVGRGETGAVGNPIGQGGAGAGGKGGNATLGSVALVAGETVTIELGTHAEVKRGATVLFRAPGGGSVAAGVPVSADAGGDGGAGGGSGGGGGGGGGGYGGGGGDAVGSGGGSGGVQSVWPGRDAEAGFGGEGGSFGSPGNPGKKYGGGGGGGGAAIAGTTAGGVGGAPCLLIEWVT